MNLSDIISSQYINEVEYMCISSNKYKNKLYIYKVLISSCDCVCVTVVFSERC